VTVNFGVDYGTVAELAFAENAHLKYLEKVAAFLGINLSYASG
jgi:hypothetical protein